MNIMKLRVKGLIGFLLMHTCDFTHKNLKGHMLLMSPRVSGMYKDWFLLMHLCNHFGNPHVFHRPAILSTQGICPPRKHYVTFFSPQGRSQHIHCLLNRKKNWCRPFWDFWTQGECLQVQMALWIFMVNVYFHQQPHEIHNTSWCILMFSKTIPIICTGCN